jgi:hypothetical protein
VKQTPLQRRRSTAPLEAGASEPLERAGEQQPAAQQGAGSDRWDRESGGRSSSRRCSLAFAFPAFNSSPRLAGVPHLPSRYLKGPQAIPPLHLPSLLPRWGVATVPRPAWGPALVSLGVRAASFLYRVIDRADDGRPGSVYCQTKRIPYIATFSLRQNTMYPRPPCWLLLPVKCKCCAADQAIWSTIRQRTMGTKVWVGCCCSVLTD